MLTTFIYKKKGFTLFEILVVLAIIFVLIGLLLPAILAITSASKEQENCSILMPEKSELIENLGNDWFIYKIKILNQEKYFLIKSKYGTKIEGITEINYLK